MKFTYQKSSLITQKDLLKTANRLAQYISRLKKIKNDYTDDYSNDYPADYPFDYPESSIVLPLDKAILHTIYKLKKEKIVKTLHYMLVIGIGGSNLGARAIYDALYGYYDAINPYRYPRIIFLDTIDSELLLHIQNILQNNITHINQVLINIISKSGETTETIANFELVYNILLKKFSKKDILKRVIITTDNKSKLFYLGQKNNISILKIPSKTGGRFSVLSAAGLFPLAVMNIDLKILQEGASSMLKQSLSCSILNNHAAISATIIYLHRKAGKNINDNFFFHPCLESLGKWYRQLIAESVGKKRDIKGKIVNAGITPTVSIGSIDLHSVGQLYLGGPKDKITTFIHTENISDKTKIPAKRLFSGLVANLGNQTVYGVLNSIYKGVKMAYLKNKLPFMEIILEDISPYSMGQFLQFKMIEVMYLGYLMNVNTFDQPSVESYKIETRKILKSSATR